MHSLAIIVYGARDSGRNALAEEKYRELADAFTSRGFNLASVSYSDDQATELAGLLPSFDAILVWVNPVEQGHDRIKLDGLLSRLAAGGCLVSAHPDVILKMGTKDILYKTRSMDWGSDVRMYSSFAQFEKEFPASLAEDGVRVLKQYRGNGGKGVFRVRERAGGKVSVTHAIAGNETRLLPMREFLAECESFFLNDGLLIDQEWNGDIVNGMVRCYVCGTRVAGFGYQEINALYELADGTGYQPPGKRFYFTENCGLFRDLKTSMESRWIPSLQASLSIDDHQMPVIWDADFFINSSESGKYTLCEINVSCVSPFPPSAIRFMVDEVEDRLSGKKGKDPPGMAGQSPE